MIKIINNAKFQIVEYWTIHSSQEFNVNSFACCVLPNLFNLINLVKFDCFFYLVWGAKKYVQISA